MCYIFRQNLAYLNQKLDEEEGSGVEEKGFRYLL